MSGRAVPLLLAACAALVMLPGTGWAQSGDGTCKDALITRIVETRLSVDREIGQFRIGVTTSECVVTLSGRRRSSRSG